MVVAGYDLNQKKKRKDKRFNLICNLYYWWAVQLALYHMEKTFTFI